MTTHHSSECLAITASGEDRVGLVEKLTSQITSSGCNIEQSRMGVLGGQFALIMRVTGSREALTALEGRLGPLGEELGLAIIHKWTRERERHAPVVPYLVEVVALDNPGIVHNLARFFCRQRHQYRGTGDGQLPRAPYRQSDVRRAHDGGRAGRNRHCQTAR